MAVTVIMAASHLHARDTPERSVQAGEPAGVSDAPDAPRRGVEDDEDADEDAEGADEADGFDCGVAAARPCGASADCRFAAGVTSNGTQPTPDMYASSHACSCFALTWYDPFSSTTPLVL